MHKCCCLGPGQRTMSRPMTCLPSLLFQSTFPIPQARAANTHVCEGMWSKVHLVSRLVQLSECQNLWGSITLLALSPAVSFWHGKLAMVASPCNLLGYTFHLLLWLYLLVCGVAGDKGDPYDVVDIRSAAP